MPFSYTGSGGFNLFGCATVSCQGFYTYKYALNSIVYNLAKAQKGKFEKHSIKKVYLHDEPYTPFFTYQDTFNEVWFEYELCTESEAIAAALIYLENKQYMIVNSLESGKPLKRRIRGGTSCL